MGTIEKEFIAHLGLNFFAPRDLHDQYLHWKSGKYFVNI